MRITDTCKKYANEPGRTLASLISKVLSSYYFFSCRFISHPDR